ncbi:3'-5' exonuclease family protein [Accumulibacter sp.]|uniref:3'-5' exonuclease family protein n=1 Tax=Accumulibacter sp. TaxID=2053492 RepID=UPI0025E34707|nr:3'-5' exonuclease family protein [Accumulibacter sp.]MCM8594565.1 exonuclease domain-containing protein [Accumulibacter sp.]MCM8627413.1 exonuclease domain-containing protein [Accumulibacter sp.]MDS4048711.1 exonuclease domain-containing protein [Accumulibacter sp.]
MSGETRRALDPGRSPVATGIDPLLVPEPLVFVDLETSGANLANDRIIEIGLVEVDASGIGEWSVLVNPETPVSAFITRLTGIDDAMLSDAPTFRELAPALIERLDGRLLLAHNARFDYGFLKSEFRRLGVDFRSPIACTVRLSRRLFPEHHRHNLDSLVERHALSVAGGRHRALADARLLWELWQCWHRELPTAAIHEAVATLVGRPDLPPQIDRRLIDDLPEAPGAYALYAGDGRLLLSQRSTNLRQQVLGHFRESQRDSPLYRSTRHIEWREAAGELGARLHEIALARQASGEGAAAPPAKSAAEVCSWQLPASPGSDFVPRLVFADDLDFAVAEDLFGLYRSPGEARRSLRTLAEARNLCLRQLGLEGPSRSGACSAYRHKACRGSCVGREAPALHGARLLQALARLRLRPWPYPGPALIVERDAFGMREDFHLIDRWRLLATLHSEDELPGRLTEGPARERFDPDLYRLFSRFLDSGKVAVRPLPPYSL